jgi:hypothetical protein
MTNFLNRADKLETKMHAKAPWFKGIFTEAALENPVAAVPYMAIYGAYSSTSVTLNKPALSALFAVASIGLGIGLGMATGIPALGAFAGMVTHPILSTIARKKAAHNEIAKDDEEKAAVARGERGIVAKLKLKHTGKFTR